MPGLEGLSSENPRQLGLEEVSYTASSEGPARREDASAQEQETGLEGTLSESLENQLPRHERSDLYYWGIDGHDLSSIYADQSDHYHSIMTSTAGPAASLDLRDHFRGPADTTLENLPEAVLYESDPKERIDLTWVDEAFGEYNAESFDETFCLAKEPPTFEEVAESFLTEPKVTFVTDAQGKTVPMTTALVVVKDIQGKRSPRVLRALLDTGGSCCMASEKILPPGTTATPEPIEMVNTLAGHMTTQASVTMTGLRLPEFDRNIVIDQQKFKTFSGPCKYDIILGADFLASTGDDMGVGAV